MVAQGATYFYYYYYYCNERLASSLTLSVAQMEAAVGCGVLPQQSGNSSAHLKSHCMPFDAEGLPVKFLIFLFMFKSYRDYA